MASWCNLWGSHCEVTTWHPNIFMPAMFYSLTHNMMVLCFNPVISTQWGQLVGDLYDTCKWQATSGTSDEPTKQLFSTRYEECVQGFELEDSHGHLS